MEKAVQLWLVVILATSVNIEHSVASLLTRPGADIESVIGTGNSLDYFGAGQPPLFVSRRPSTTIQGAIYIVIRMEQLNELRQ